MAGSIDADSEFLVLQIRMLEYGLGSKIIELRGAQCLKHS